MKDELGPEALATIQRLLSTFESDITINPLGIGELACWLEDHCCVEETTLLQLDEVWRDTLMRHWTLNGLPFTDIEQYPTRIFRVLPVAKNARYVELMASEVAKLYPESLPTKPEVSLQQDIYVVLEPRTEHIYSNCGLLFLELEIAYGITQQDMDSRTFRLLNYLTRLHQLHERWY